MSLQKPLFVRAWSVARAAVLVCVLSTMGYAVPTGVKVSPGSIRFGNCVVGGTSLAKTVTVTNDSREGIKIASVSLSSLEFVYSGPVLPVTLAPGQSFSGSVMFLPTAARRYSARLTFETNRSLFWSTTVELAGTGTAAPSSALSSSTSSSSSPTAAVTPTITWAAPAAITYGTALSAAQLDATASTVGSFAYSPASGTVLTAGSHTLSVTFTPTNTTAYTAAADSVVLTVNKVTPTITWATPAAITSGTALSATQLDATANVAGSFAYSSALGTVLTAGSHTLSVTFTPSDTTDYNTASSSVVLIVNTVNRVTPTITWATPTAISYGTALSATQLDATASTAGSFAYSPALGTVPTAGNQTLSVTFTPTDTTDYNAATGSVVLTVNKVTPTITWATPTAMTSGMTLSAAQLDASANTAGSFAYAPALGTVLSAGSQTLSVTFTPSDTTDYNTATDSVPLSVNSATPAVSPSSFNFGSVHIGVTSSSETFTVSNESSNSMTSINVSITASYFTNTGTGSCGSTLAASGTCTIIVNFTPTAATSYTATLQLSYSGGDGVGSVSASLGGTGISNCPSPIVVNGTYNICSEAFAEESTEPGTTVSAPFTPYGGNGVELFVEWCIVGCNANATQTVTVSDNVNSPETCFVEAPHSPYQIANPSVPDYPIVFAYYCPSIPSGVTTLTATVSGSVDFLEIQAQEIQSGEIAATNYFESVDQGQNSGNVANTTASISTSGSTVNSNDLVTALVVNCGGSIGATAGTGWTGVTVNPSWDPGWVLEDKGVTSTGTQTATTTWSSGTASGNCALGKAAPNTTSWGAIVALKAPGGAVAPPALATGTLTVSPTSVSLGNVNVGANGSQTVTLTNSGSGSVTISNVSTTSGVGVSGASTGMVLTGGQSATLGLTFAVSDTGSITGGVTVASNASNPSLTIPVSANGVNHSVFLSWSADSSATGGYNVYSSTVSGGPYNRLTSTPVATPAYTDNTVQAGLTYYYVVTAVDATANTQSGYSNQAAAVVP